MIRKATTGILLLMLLTGAMAMALGAQTVEASETIYIRASGAIEPLTAPILRANDTYNLTGSINAPIVIERSNILINGQGYTVQVGPSETAITLDGVTNVTINNIKISNSEYGVFFHNTRRSLLNGSDISGIGTYGIVLESSSNNTLSGNSVRDAPWGIYLYYSSNNTIVSSSVRDAPRGIYFYYSPSNTIIANSLENNTYSGIELSDSPGNEIRGNSLTSSAFGVNLQLSSNNTVTGNLIAGMENTGITCYRSSYNTITLNNITANNFGIDLSSSSGNQVAGNNITKNRYGIFFYNSSGNKMFHNYFINNTNHVTSPSLENMWDDGYPSGGNFWGNYTGVDAKSGANQDLPGSDGIGDTPYIINSNNRDRYPLSASAAPAPGLNVSISLPSTSMSVGQSVTLSSMASGGRTPYSYQWYLNSSPVAGATSATWTFTPASSGTYSVHLRVSDADSRSAGSGTALITVTAGTDQTPWTMVIIAAIALIALLLVLILAKRRRGKQQPPPRRSWA